MHLSTGGLLGNYTVYLIEGFKDGLGLFKVS